MRRHHAQEAKEEAFDAEDAQANGKIVGPAGLPGGSRHAGGGTLPSPPQPHSQDEDEDCKAGSQDRVQRFRPTAQEGIGGGDSEGEEDAAHGCVAGCCSREGWR